MKKNQNKHRIRKSVVAMVTALSVLMGSTCFVMANEITSVPAGVTQVEKPAGVGNAENVPTKAPENLGTPVETPKEETGTKLPSLSDFFNKELPELPEDFKPAPVVPGAKEEQLKDQIEKAPDEIIVNMMKKKHDNDDSLSREDKIAVESTVDKMTKMPLLDEMEAAMAEMETAEEMSAYYEKAAAERQAALDAYFAMSEELRKEIPLALVHELQAEMADAWAGKVLEEVVELTPVTLATTSAPTYQSGMTETWSAPTDPLYTFKHGTSVKYYQRSPHLFGSGTPAATYMLFDTTVGTSYTTDGKAYDPENGRYAVTFCCDRRTDVVAGTYYQRKNLEDVTAKDAASLTDDKYYTEDSAQHIRGIVSNAYPFISASDMREALDKSDGNDDNTFKGYNIAEIEEAEMLAAAQFAIWHFANTNNGDYSSDASYTKTSTYGQKNVIYSLLGTRYSEDGTQHSDVKTRIDAIYNYLINLKGQKAEADEVVISKVALSTPYPIVQKNPNGTYTATLTVTLGGTLGTDGSGTMTLKKNDETTAFKTVDLKDVLGASGKTYTMKLELNQGDVVHVAVSGTQDLPEGVYFYSPQGGRNVAQSFVGIAAGKTPFKASSEVTFNDPGVALQIVKTVRDYDGNVAPLSGVTFKLSYDDTNNLFDFSNYTYRTDANGHIDLAGLNGSGTYTLEEVEPTYFKDVMPIRFTVENDQIKFEDYTNAEGKPVVSLNLANGNDPAKVEVENRRFDRGSTEIKALKRLNDKLLPADTKEEFEFTLTEINKDGTPVADSPYTKTVTNLNDGDTDPTQVFFELKNLEVEDGQRVKELFFELKEVDLGERYYTYDDSVYKIKVTVTPEATGEKFVPNVEVTYYKDNEEVKPDEVAFDNYWKKDKNDNITVTVKKVWAVASDVEIPESVTVELVNEKGNASAGTRVLSEENGWKASWTVDEDETWAVKEINVPDGFKASYSGDQEEGFIVTNSGDGNGGNNGGDTSAKVTKKWSGDSEEDRPDSIKVQLYRDGEAYGDVVTLSEEDGWSYDWGKLDDSYEWTVEEIDVPSGYVSKVEGSVEDGFTITNSVSDDSNEEEKKTDDDDDGDGDDDDGDVLGIEDENVPKGDMVLADEEEVLAAETGDSNHIVAAGAAMAAALIGIVLLRRKKTN
ncbi:Cna B-type domain-containing protein [Anaerotignum sp.]